MSKRSGVTASLRWQVFARDNFTCMYCGAQAGEAGVSLAADHIVSVADGGEDNIDNLVTACQRCNGGKGARSLTVAAPGHEHAVAAAQARAARLADLAEATKAAMKAKLELEQQIVNVKCYAYGVSKVGIAKGEKACAVNLLREFGVEFLSEWYSSAAARSVGEYDAIRYVCGCARNRREVIALKQEGNE